MLCAEDYRQQSLKVIEPYYYQCYAALSPKLIEAFSSLINLQPMKDEPASLAMHHPRPIKKHKDFAQSVLSYFILQGPAYLSQYLRQLPNV